jgi:NAD(P)-dependent dehydrogenase (short-subunit alcohol dehydrogenase family)
VDIDRLFDIRGKTALVTGASGGIGYMIADGLVRAGAKVWICSRKSADILAAAERLRQFGPAHAVVPDAARSVLEDRRALLSAGGQRLGMAG